MKLSNQAMGAVMMALQKCIIEQSDIVEILKGFDFELGVEKVVIPQGRMASTWCAFGAASADMLHIAEHVNIITSPFSVEDINANFEFMLDELRSQLAAEGTPSESQIFHCSLDVRHKGQINEVEVPLSGVEFSVSQVAKIDKDFLKKTCLY